MTNQIENNQKFPKIGVDMETVPDDKESTWWPTQKVHQEGSSSDKNSITEEIENFKKIPVIGKLLWKTQYIIFSSLMCIGMIILLAISLKNIQLGKNAVVFKNDIVFIQKNNMLPSQYQEHVNALHNVTVEQKKVLENLSSSLSLLKNVSVASSQVSNVLTQTVNKITPYWRKAGETGEWTSVDAVNFAQTLSEIQYIQETVSRLNTNNQEKIPDRLSQSRQNIEQAFRIYANSPSSKQNTYLTQAWKLLAKGFIDIRPQLESIIGAQKEWNTIQTVFAQTEHESIISKSSNYIAIIFIAMITVVFSGAMLVWIGFKQQKFKILEAQIYGENLKISLDEFSKPLKLISKGDFTTVVNASNPVLLSIAHLFNFTIKKIHNLIVDTKLMTKKTISVFSNFSLYMNKLIEQTEDLTKSIQYKTTEYQKSHEQIKMLSELSSNLYQKIEEIQNNITPYSLTTKNITNQWNVEKQNTVEIQKKYVYLHKSLNEILFLSTFLNEVSEQISVLSIQAGIQAVKAGTSGQGFKVIADGLKILASKSNEHSHRVTTLIETTLHDIVQIKDTLNTQITSTKNSFEEINGLNIFLQEMTSQLTDVLETTHKMCSSIQNQEKTASILIEKNNTELEHVDEITSNTLKTKNSLLDLMKRIEDLDVYTNKFKVYPDKQK